MRIALVHDFLTQFGGAERVLSAIHEIWPDTPVYTSIFDPGIISKLSSANSPRIRFESASGGWRMADGGWDIRPSFLQTFPPARWFTKYFTFLVPLAFEEFDLSDFDVIISSSANFAKGVITQPHQLHICYCHTPPRFLYHYPSETDKRSHFLWGPILRSLDNYLRIWDYWAAQRVDYFIANSKTVAARIKKFYGREAEVIYPPVETQNSSASWWIKTQNYNSKLKSSKLKPKEQNSKEPLYFLVVSRLSRYKNVNLAIEASNRLRFPLKIVGTGREEKNLKKIAGPTVEFLGTISDKELAKLYQNCQAVIFPVQDEDFGIVPVEAMSFGKPVVALRSGGVVESVIDPSTSSPRPELGAKAGQGATGVFFDEPTVESLVSVLRHFDTTSYKSSDCWEQAKKFSKERFQQELKDFVEEKWAEFQVEKV